MLRYPIALFAIILLCSAAAIEVHAQGIIQVNGSSHSMGNMRAAGMIPPVDNEPGVDFEYDQTSGGPGGFQMIWGDSILNSEHFVNVITSGSSMFLPGAHISSTSSTNGSTGGMGELGGEIFRGRMLTGEAGVMTEAAASYLVTGPPPAASEAYIFKGTFSVGAHGTGTELGGWALGPGVNAVATGDEILVTWTNVFQSPATQTVLVPGGTTFSGTFAIGVFPGDELTLSTIADSALGPVWNTSAASNANAAINGEIEVFALTEIADLVFDPGSAGAPGGGSGGTGGGERGN